MNKIYCIIILMSVLISCRNKNYIEMVYVEGGTLEIGCNEKNDKDCEDDEIRHIVTLEDFYIGKYEITQEQWVSVMGQKNNPSYFGEEENYKNLPVESVSYNEVLIFIHRLNVKTGKQYRLPTEAEWEYAAKGGQLSKNYKYSGSNNIDDVAWYDGNSKKRTHDVGSKKPNELGIYDMSGNVYEWCSSVYSDYNNNADIKDSLNFLFDTERVFRGGSWIKGAEFCRNSNRGSGKQKNKTFFIGFRLVLDKK